MTPDDTWYGYVGTFYDIYHMRYVWVDSTVEHFTVEELFYTYDMAVLEIFD